MKCKTLHKKLIFFLEGDLPAREAEEMAAHLAQCDACAAFAEEMKKTLDIIQVEKSPEMNPFFYTRLKARMESEEVQEKQQIGFPVWEKVLQPALFSLLLLAGIYTGIKIGQPANTETDHGIFAETELVPFLNEMEAEPIETFLME
ncbi:MAG: anti-sigma factor family protein [Mariniphaga sp.]